MSTQQQLDFLNKALAHAQLASHLFPEYAASEAALESAWGNSTLCREGNNLFGEKQHATPIYDTLTLPTKEYIQGDWIEVDAHWVKFPSWKESFQSRMETLRRLSSTYPHYAAALAAPDGATFITEVSKTWSTDPLRAEKVLAIHRIHFSPLGEVR